jgi:hypothetical protein
LQVAGSQAAGRAVPENLQPATCNLQTYVVRPLLSCSRAQILAYLKTKRQPFCTDETNFDTGIPRNALRNLVLPLLEEKVHAGTRAALWRLAEEAETSAAKQIWRREWLAAFAGLGLRECLTLPLAPSPRVRFAHVGPPPRGGEGEAPSVAECADLLDVLRVAWNITAADFTQAHAHALQRLFAPRSGPKRIDLPGGIVAERTRSSVILARQAPGTPFAKS